MNLNCLKTQTGKQETPEEKAERIRNYKRKWASLNPDKVFKNSVVQNKKQSDSGYKAKKAAEYREKNPERSRLNYKKYYYNNLKHVRSLKASYKLKMHSANPSAKLAAYYRKRVYSALKKCENTIKYKTQDILGCDYTFLKSYLESLFKPGMSWENYGQWHVDHIISCCTFNLTDESQLKKCFNYKNLQPLWAKDNLIKSKKLLEDKTYKAK